MSWVEPKTNWTTEDRFNISDFNRIKNNLLWLHEKVSELYRPFEIEYMGEDITTYEDYWNVDYFNAFETNLDRINQNMLKKDYGVSQRFFENAPFIQANELNRIENACLSMKKIIETQEIAFRRLPFNLGGFKAMRV